MVAKIISLFSAPFYTGHYGYKMCLLFYMNGDGSVKGTHLSPFSPSIGGVSTMHSGRFRKGGSTTGMQNAPENFGVATPTSDHVNAFMTHVIIV